MKNLFKIAILFSIILLSLFAFIIINNSYTQYQIDIKNLKKEYLTQQKQFIKQETIRVLNYIKYKAKTNKNRSLKDLQNEIVEVIEYLRNTRDGTGYIFIYTFDGVNIADPILKENSGKNLINFTDPNGKKVIYELIKISQKKDGGYVRYVWNKPTTNTLENKISYAISYKSWRWMIGSGVYLDNVEKEIREKEQEYKNKLIKYIWQIIFLSLILFIMGYLLDRYFTYELKESEEYTKELLKAQDKFIDNAVHEINTPLSIIITNIDLFKLKYGENRYLSKIEAGSKIIHNIYNDLSYVIKKDRIKYSKSIINFSDFLEFRIEFFNEVAYGNHLQLHSSIKNNIFIKFNDTQLQRICDNSISNAIKYSYENKKIKILLKQSKKYIIFMVINSSDTIEDPNKLFSRFYRENKSRGGFGLGLSIVKDICDNNNVTIKVKSKNNITKFIYKFKNENTTT